MTLRPAKTQISLGICPVWSESSLCAQWVGKDSNFLHADSEDSDQTGPRCWFCHEAAQILTVAAQAPSSGKNSVAFTSHTEQFVWTKCWYTKKLTFKKQTANFPMILAQQPWKAHEFSPMLSSLFVWIALRCVYLIELTSCSFHSYYWRSSFLFCKVLCSELCLQSEMSRDMTKPTKWLCA